jgi:hypothetical protein
MNSISHVYVVCVMCVVCVTHAHTNEFRGQQLTSGVLFYCLPLQFWYTVFSLNLELTLLSRLGLAGKLQQFTHPYLLCAFIVCFLHYLFTLHTNCSTSFSPIPPSLSPSPIPFSSDNNLPWHIKSLSGTNLPWHIKSLKDLVHSLPLRPEKVAQ